MYDRYGPYQIPRIKGTFALHQLRLAVGNEKFLELMRTIHERYAEKAMSNDQLMSVIAEMADSSAVELVQQWLTRKHLPQLEPAVKVEQKDDKWEVRLSVAQRGPTYHLFTHMTIEAGDKRHVRRVELEGPTTEATFTFDDRPAKIEFNAFNDVPVENPDFYTWGNLIDDFHHTLIVYGTAREDEANHTLARHWQKTVANAYIEILPPLVKDSELTIEQATDHDLIVIGTLDDNRWIAELTTDLPVTFGRNHFTWRGETYAHPDDGLFLVLPNPYNAKRVMYVIAANSALELYEMTKTYPRIPSWALFRKAEIVDKGYHPVKAFEFEGGMAEPAQSTTGKS